MSEPVSNAEIEDVLSSIRRLVSENSGAIRRGRDDEQAAEKLVLTPAFRVDEDEGAADAAEAPSDVIALDAKLEPVESEGPDTETLEAHVAAAVEEAAAEAEPAGEGDAAAEAMPEAAAQPDAPSESAMPESDDEASDGEPGPDIAETDAQSLLERRIAELEAVIARSSADFEPDGSEAEDVPQAVALDPVEAPAAAVNEVHGPAPDEAAPEMELSEAVVPETIVPEPVVPETAAEEPAPDEATVDVVEEEAVLEAEVALEPTAPADAAEDAGAEAAPEVSVEVTETAEDAAQEWDDFSLDAVAAAAGYEANFEAASEMVVEEALPEEAAPEEASAADETVLDEDALRELVARMVREELQGNVGERITHNVRRMVRREIARALALQNFE